jgi:hypothetical protein
VEVLIALGILTFGLLPVVTMDQNTTRKGGLSEFHIFFQARAVRVAEFYSSYNYDFFRNALLSAGARRVSLPIEGKIPDPALPVEYARKLAGNNFEESCTIELEDNAGLDLVRLTVAIRWRFPLDDNTHGYTLVRLFARPDVTLTENDVVYAPDGP